MNSKILIGVILVIVILVTFTAIFMLKNLGSYQITIQYSDGCFYSALYQQEDIPVRRFAAGVPGRLE